MMIVLRNTVGNYVTITNYIISFMGCYATANLADLLRVSKKIRSKTMGSLALLTLMAISLSGVSIWIEHSSLVCSVLQKVDDETDCTKSFSVLYASLSALVAIIFTFGGLFISSSDRAFFKSKIEIAEMVKEDARILTIQQIRKSNNLIFLALSKNLKPLLLGGIITGVGSNAMCFIGIMGVKFDGYIEINPGIAISSAILSIFGSIFSFWILFRLQALNPDKELYRIAGSLVMAGVVLGSHFIGLRSVTYIYDPYQHHTNGIFFSSTPDIIMQIGFIIVICILWAIIILVITDLRSGFYGQLDILTKIDTLLKSSKQLIAASSSDNNNIVNLKNVLKKYDEIIVNSECYTKFQGAGLLQMEWIGIVSRSGRRVIMAEGPRDVNTFLNDLEQGNFIRSNSLHSPRKCSLEGRIEKINENDSFKAHHDPSYSERDVDEEKKKNRNKTDHQNKEIGWSIGATSYSSVPNSTFSRSLSFGLSEIQQLGVLEKDPENKEFLASINENVNLELIRPPSPNGVPPSSKS